MRITKEKILAAASALVTAATLSGVRPPRVEDVPGVPPEEGAKPYRSAAAAPRLAPEKVFTIAMRDPFRQDDPWQSAAPALLAVPPGESWARALPVGTTPVALAPGDRLLFRGKLTLLPGAPGIGQVPPPRTPPPPPPATPPVAPPPSTPPPPTPPHPTPPPTPPKPPKPPTTPHPATPPPTPPTTPPQDPPRGGDNPRGGDGPGRGPRGPRGPRGGNGGGP